MTDDDRRWREVDTLFEEALDRPPGERRAYLERACTDPEIRLRVSALLDAEAASAPFLERRPDFARALLDALREGAGDGATDHPHGGGRGDLPRTRDGG